MSLRMVVVGGWLAGAMPGMAHAADACQSSRSFADVSLVAEGVALAGVGGLSLGVAWEDPMLARVGASGMLLGGGAAVVSGVLAGVEARQCGATRGPAALLVVSAALFGVGTGVGALGGLLFTLWATDDQNGIITGALGLLSLPVMAVSGGAVVTGTVLNRVGRSKVPVALSVVPLIGEAPGFAVVGRW